MARAQFSKLSISNPNVSFCFSKVETLNELTENNKSLREDRDKLSARLAEVEKNLANMETEVVIPNKQNIASLQAHVEQLQTENTALKAENQR